ncbi:hypothetical protein ABPG75_013535 [Micractinium tetrahymenae]
MKRGHGQPADAFRPAAALTYNVTVECTRSGTLFRYSKSRSLPLLFGGDNDGDIGSSFCNCTTFAIKASASNEAGTSSVFTDNKGGAGFDFSVDGTCPCLANGQVCDAAGSLTKCQNLGFPDLPCCTKNAFPQEFGGTRRFCSCLGRAAACGTGATNPCAFFTCCVDQFGGVAPLQDKSTNKW